MQINEYQMALATRCLWSLQEASHNLEGLLLTYVDGLTLTSTFDGGDSMQRLAAVGTTLFLLGEEASDLWGRGESLEMHLLLRYPEHEDKKVRYVYMCPVSYRAVLLAVYLGEEMPSLLEKHVKTAAQYLEAVLDGYTPPEPHWEG